MKKILPILGMFLLSFIVKGQIGEYALKFDGTDDYVSINHNESFNMNKVTIEAWIYWEETNGNEVDFVIAKGFEQFEIHTGGLAGYNALRFIPKSGLWLDTRTNVIEPNKWYHIAFCYDPNSTGAHKTCYINGKYENLNVASGDTNSAIQTSEANFLIGNRNAASLNFKGKIDEVRIWNTIRTQNEIKANMYKELSGNESGLAAYYKMSNGTGTTLTDNQTSSTNAGTLTNGTTWVASGCFAGSRNALDFDGTDDYIDCGNSSLFNMSNAITIEAWVNINNTTTGMFVAGKFEHSGSGEGYGLFINSYSLGGGAGKVSFIAGQSWSNWWGITSNSVIPINTWNHIVGVFDGRYLKVYINGNFDGITDLGSDKTISNSTTYNFSIGKRIFEDADKFNGKIDEVRIWNTVRTESEIRENMMTNLVGNESGLVAYYRFDNYDGTTLYDLTSNGLNGTLTNMDAATDWVTSSAYNIWLGGESNNWTTAANWSNGVPTATDNIGFYKWNLSNVTTHDVSQSSDFTTNSLFISSTANPTLPTTFTVNGSFVTEKNIDITGKTITLGSSGYLSEGNYRLYGTSGTISTTRTLGKLNSENVAGLGAAISSDTKIYTVSNAGTSGVNGIYEYYDSYDGKNRYKKGDYYIIYEWGSWYICEYKYLEWYGDFLYCKYYSSSNEGIDSDPPTDGWNINQDWDFEISGEAPVPDVNYTDPQYMGITTITRGHSTQTQDGQNSIKRYYQINPTNNTNLNATLVFKYHTDELNGLTEDNLKLFKETSPNVWVVQESSVLDAANNTLTLSGISSFSKWTAAENSAFPVELKTLKAVRQYNKVIITWQTGTEINNYGFEIERAQVVEGKACEYNKIGFVQGHGNSNTIIDYTFTDVEVRYGKYSYRLKQIDNDGKYSYSNSVETEINNITNYSLSQNYPNPFNPSTTISYEISKPTNVTLKVYNILGKEVVTLVNEKQETGIYKKEFDGSKLSSGIYYYKLETDGFSQVKKMTLIK